MKKLRSFRVFCLMLALLTLAGCGDVGSSRTAPAEERPAEGELELYCFDAGKADALLLTTAESAVLIDCGEKGFGQTILAELEGRGIEKLDALILTHFDKDHIGGAAKVINSLPVMAVYQSVGGADSSEYIKYLRALRSASIEPVIVTEPLSFTLDGAEYRIEPPLKEHYDEDESNNLSLIVTVRHGGNSLLFMGDAQSERIAEYLAAAPMDCDFLKVAHHGGKEKKLSELLSAVRPELAVITCSDRERENAATLAALKAAGAEVYLTREGAVRILSDGRTLRVIA